LVNYWFTRFIYFYICFFKYKFLEIIRLMDDVFQITWRAQLFKTVKNWWSLRISHSGVILTHAKLTTDETAVCDRSFMAHLKQIMIILRNSIILLITVELWIHELIVGINAKPYWKREVIINDRYLILFYRSAYGKIQLAFFFIIIPR